MMGMCDSVSARLAGQGPGCARTHPWPRECAPQSRELLPPGLLVQLRLPPPPALAQFSRRRPRWFLRDSLRKASGRSAVARRPGVRPSAARGERVRRGGPGAGERRGEGEGRTGRGRSVAGRRAGAASTAASPPPSPPLPQLTLPPPRPGVHPLPPRGSLRGTTISQVGAQPRPTPALLGGPPTQTLPGFFPVSIPRDGRSSLFPMCPSALSAAPRPQLLTPVWAMSCTTLWPRPGTWRVGGRRGPGRRAERCAGQGMRPGDGGDAESLQCVSECERTAPGEQVPVARRAHQRASKQRPPCIPVSPRLHPSLPSPQTSEGVRSGPRKPPGGTARGFPESQGEGNQRENTFQQPP
ncbi:uncharacterized protein ACOB7L_002665 [Callospermophilus lateralis]